MKFLVVILSLYFLALNIVPCCESEICDENYQVTTIVGVDDEHDHNQDCELCSPFCQCQCCHVYTINLGLFEVSPLHPFLSYENASYRGNLGKEIPRSLLQPPQA